jgi:hypothetical protein
VGWVSGKSNVGAAGFCVLVCVWVCFCCCSVGCLCQGLWGLGLCKVGTVVWSAGGEWVGGRGSVVTGWGRIGGKVKAGEESG